MRYIRTKDGIYEKDKLIYAFNDNEEYLIKDIVKEADTIEELCDLFVVKTNTDNNIHYSLQVAKKLEHYNSKVYQNKPIIYGAIWTDKGLIYVAKMNEKGELELL